MKKRILSFGLALLLINGLTLPVYADSFQGGSGWQVKFTDENKMESNFKTSDMDDSVSVLQPGDSVVFTINLKNENSTATDWWMTNEVLKSLEDGSPNGASGGAYEYVLTYKDKTGEEVTLFDSDRVGGEDGYSGLEGLHAATIALDEYFYLDTLDFGQSGIVTLQVSLDGETQGNTYQDTLANLQMNFAVELNPDENTSTGWRLVNGEDESGSASDSASNSESIQLRNAVRTDDQTNLTPYFIAMAVSGTFILILAIYSMKRSRQDKKEAE